MSTGGRILVVDRNVIAQATIRDALAGAGYTVEAATSAVEALEALKHPCDLVFLHRGLPDSNCDDLVRAARSKVRAKVILLSSENSAEVEKDHLRLGTDEILYEPLDPLSIRSCVQRHIHGDGFYSDVPDRPRILLVDDDIMVRQAVEDVLEGRYEAKAFGSPGQALQQLREEPFEILLTDLKMPEMNGMDLVHAAKNLRPSILAIVMTGFATKEMAVRSLKEGVYDFLEKPLNPHVVIGTVERAWKSLRFELENRRLLSEMFKLNAQLKDEMEERNRLEMQLLHAQKMEAIGSLAGGVAHDFNNFLMVIMGYNELNLGIMDGTTIAARNSREIQKASERAAKVVRHLLAYGRRQVMSPEIMDLNRAIRRMKDNLNQLFEFRVDVINRMEPNLWKVEIDPEQVEQFIVNLAINAHDAMPEGGSFTLETKNVDFESRPPDPMLNLQSGRYVRLDVSDTGTGMERDVMARCFEPFFTTKSRGHGKGLGLSSAYGIVKQSGGEMTVYSEPGKGTRFTVYLPAMAEHTRESGRMLKPADGTTGAGGMVLVAEDDNDIRGLIRDTLEAKGFQVIVGMNGKDAYARAKRHGQSFQLLITDVLMPRMSGLELARRMRERQPDLRVLFISGFTDPGAISQEGSNEKRYFLQKPFGPFTLLARVQEIMEEPAEKKEQVQTEADDQNVGN